jgi:hypothetical protein
MTRLLLPTLLLALAVTGFAQEKPAAPSAPARAAAPAPPAAAPADDAAVIAAQKPSYPLTTCVVSGEAFGGAMGEPVDFVHAGRYMKLCCPSCKDEIAKAPAKYAAKLDAAVVAAQKPAYPLTTCPISGEPLGSKPVEVVSGTRLVQLCCNDCKAEFAKDPAPALAKVDAALIAAQSASYPLATCVVSGEKLEDPVEVLYGVQLVKFCCKQCVGEFRGNPEKFLAQIRAGDKGSAPAGGAAPVKEQPAHGGH